MALHRFPFRAMASPCALHLGGDDPDLVARTARAAALEVTRIEAKYTRYRDDSVTAAINRSAGSREGCAVDDETAALLDYAETAWAQSDGLFDVTSGVLREVWDFRSGVLPARRDVARVLERVGWQRVAWRRPVLRLAAGMQIDFGGYGKEYAADRAAEVCLAHGVGSGLVDLGGDVRLLGPLPDGGSLPVGILGPRRPRGPLAVLDLEAGAVATSGDYQRCLQIDGVRYSHILDPRTGWPVSGLSSVSVVAGRCLVAGTAATIAMLKGEDGADWLHALGLPSLWVDREGRVGGCLADGDYGCAETPGGEPRKRRGGAVARAVSPGSTTT